VCNLSGQHSPLETHFSHKPVVAKISLYGARPPAPEPPRHLVWKTTGARPGRMTRYLTRGEPRNLCHDLCRNPGWPPQLSAANSCSLLLTCKLGSIGLTPRRLLTWAHSCSLLVTSGEELSRQRPRVRVPSSPPFLSSTCRELAILLMVQFGPVRPVSRLCRAPGALVCFELPVLLHSSLSVQIERDPTRRVVSARSRQGTTAMSLIMEVVAHRRQSSVGP
jgi:hypothetical protein